MAHFKKLPQKKEGKIIYGNGIVDGIVVLAIAEIPYVELFSVSSKSNQSNSVKVDIQKDGVNIDVFVKIHFTQSVSDMAFKIQESIRHNVEAMTEYHILSVNIIVKGLLFDTIHENINSNNNVDNNFSNTSNEASNDNSN